MGTRTKEGDQHGSRERCKKGILSRRCWSEDWISIDLQGCSSCCCSSEALALPSSRNPWPNSPPASPSILTHLFHPPPGPCGVNCGACDNCCRCNCGYDAGEYNVEDQRAGMQPKKMDAHDVAGESAPPYAPTEPMKVQPGGAAGESTATQQVAP